MRLFTIKGDDVEIHPETLTIPEFKELWDSDRTKSKTYTRMVFAYTYHLLSPGSPYVNVRNKKEELQKNILNGKKLTKKAKAAIDKYVELTETPEERLLKAALVAVDKVSEFLVNIDLNTVNERTGSPVYKVTDITKALREIRTISKDLVEIKDLLKSNEEESEEFRGGQELNMFDRQNAY